MTDSPWQADTGSPDVSTLRQHDRCGALTPVDVVGTVVHARVAAKNWTRLNATDLFLPVQFNGEWKIIDKVFHLH